MGIIFKIVAAVVNGACLLVTLAYPCEATMFSLLPVIVTSSSWIVGSIRKRENQVSISAVILISIAALAGGTCFFLALTSSIVQDAKAEYLYDILFNSSVAFLGTKSFDYIIFVKGICIVYLGITIPEMWAYCKRGKQTDDRGSFYSFDDIVNRVIAEK